MEARRHWVDMPVVIQKVKAYLTALPSIPTFKDSRAAVILSLFVMTAQVRPQNGRLLVHNGQTSRLMEEATLLVARFNDNLDDNHLSVKKVTGVIVRRKTPDGFFRIVWVDYKNQRTLGASVYVVSNPLAVQALETWFTHHWRADVEPRTLFQQQDRDGTIRPLLKISALFSQASLKAVGTSISIMDVRKSGTTWARSHMTDDQYERYCAFCLHTKDVADKFYNKPSSIDIAHQSSELQAILGDDVALYVGEARILISAFISLPGTTPESQFARIRDFIASSSLPGQPDYPAHESPTIINVNHEPLLQLPVSPLAPLVSQPGHVAPAASPSPHRSLNAEYWDQDLSRFVCPECRRRYPYSRNLTRHFRRKHPEFRRAVGPELP